VVLLNVQNVFDTIDHTILLYKLKMMGLNQNVVRWFHLYVSGKQKCIDISGTNSPFAYVTMVYTKASFWSYVFLIYVNDIACVNANVNLNIC
jgi:hypothetical protein